MNKVDHYVTISLCYNVDRPLEIRKTIAYILLFAVLYYEQIYVMRQMLINVRFYKQTSSQFLMYL